MLLDSDLAALYGVPTKALNQAVKRNIERFPAEFAFQLTREEFDDLRSQIVTSSSHGGRRFLPHVFTEHGALMAANVLNSSRAVTMSVTIVKTFVKLRRFALSVDELGRKVDVLEKGFRQHGQQFELVFKAIRQLMEPPAEPPKRKIGFHPTKD